MATMHGNDLAGNRKMYISPLPDDEGGITLSKCQAVKELIWHMCNFALAGWKTLEMLFSNTTKALTALLHGKQNDLAIRGRNIYCSYLVWRPFGDNYLVHPCDLQDHHVPHQVIPVAYVLWLKWHSQTLWRLRSTLSRLGGMQGSMSPAVPETDVAILVSNLSNPVIWTMFTFIVEQQCCLSRCTIHWVYLKNVTVFKVVVNHNTFY